MAQHQALKLELLCCCVFFALSSPNPNRTRKNPPAPAACEEPKECMIIDDEERVFPLAVSGKKLVVATIIFLL